jgi:hypothetical protein
VGSPTLAFNVAMGLMYGTRSAVFMDITNPAVAATQFTAYMALMNLAIAFSATWQGVAIEALGYPATLLLDAGVGPALQALTSAVALAGAACLAGLARLPWTELGSASSTASDPGSDGVPLGAVRPLG